MSSEDAEMWREYCKMKQAKKRSNKQKSTDILEQYGFHFRSHNHGIHLVIEHNCMTVDFWPSTGKWIHRQTQKKGRGIFPLMDYLRSSSAPLR